MRFEELSSHEIAALDRERTVLVLPLGSVEQHGRHMPLGTDTMLAQAVALAAAERLAGRIAVLPPPWYGFSVHHMRFPGSVTLRAKTLIALTEDIVGSVVAHGFRRILMLNGHGGNGGVLDVLAATLGHRHYGRARVAGVTYFRLAQDAITRLRETEMGGMGHACEFETAMLLHVRPDLVALDRVDVTYPDPESPYLSTDLLASQSVRTYLDFADLSPSGTLGDPTPATVEKGAAFFTACAEELAGFLVDFAGWPIPGAAEPPS